MAFNVDNFRSILFYDTFEEIRRDEETNALYLVVIDKKTKEIIVDTSKIYLDKMPF